MKRVLFIAIICVLFSSALSYLSGEEYIWEEDFTIAPDNWSLDSNWLFIDQHLRFYYTPRYDEYTLSATSPMITLPENPGDLLVYQWIQYWEFVDEAFEIAVLSGGDIHILWTHNDGSDWGIAGGELLSLSLEAYANQNIQLRFRSYGSSTWSIDWWRIYHVIITESNTETVTIGSGTQVNTTTGAAPVNIYRRSIRSQTVYTITELNEAGIVAMRDLLSMAYYVTSAPANNLPNFRISIKHTTATDASNHDPGPFTLVYENSSFNPIANQWNELILDTPFTWNGAENILIDTSFDLVPTASSSGQQRIFSATNGMRFNRSDTEDAQNLETLYTVNYKPQIRLTFSLGSPISGIYEINQDGTGDFLTFNGALGYLMARGIDGEVIFNVHPGIYNEQVLFNGMIPGSSAVNTVTFRGVNLDNRTTILRYAPAIITNRHVIRIAGTKHLRFENFSIEAVEPADYGWTVHIMSNSEDIQIKDCHIETITHQYSTSYLGIVVSGSTSSHTVNASNVNDLLISNNTIVGGYAGIWTRSIATPPLNNLQILNNEVVNSIYYGIYVNYASAPQIKYNNIHSEGIDYISGYGITLLNLSNGFELAYNRIRDVGYVGVFINNSSASSANPNRIYNNMIGGGFRYPTSAYGIYMENTDYCNIYYNSINIDTYSGSALYVYNDSRFLRVLNNSFSYFGTGDGRAVHYVAVPNTLTESNFNNYYTDQSSRFIHFGAEMSSLSPMQSQGYDQNSYVGDPSYLSMTDLHSQGMQLWQRGISIADINDDIDGDLRNPTTPCIGVDEFEVYANDLAAVSISGPQTAFIYDGLTTDFSITISNLGTAAQNNYTVKLILAGSETEVASATITEPLPSGATIEVSLNWSPGSEGIHHLYGKVILAGDMNAQNNETDQIQVYSMPAISAYPFLEDFDGVTQPELPLGWAVENANQGLNHWTNLSLFPNSPPNAMTCYASLDMAANDWFYSPALVLEAGATYQVSFMYRAFAELDAENLKVGIGQQAHSSAMNGNIIFNHIGFNHNVYQRGSGLFTPEEDGVYFIGWHKYSAAAQGGIAVDDVKIGLAPLSGFYVISQDGTGDFESFSDATTYLLNFGVDGPVFFEVSVGAYEEQLLFDREIPGASETNTITFTGFDQNPENVVLRYSPIETDNSYAMRLLNVSHLRFNNMSIEIYDASMIFSWAVQIMSGCSDLEFTNSVIIPQQMGFSFGVLINGSTSEFYEGATDSGQILFQNNTFLGGLSGIYMSGVAESPLSGIDILNNNFEDTLWRGIYANRISALNIRHNSLNILQEETGRNDGAVVFLENIFAAFTFAYNKITYPDMYGLRIYNAAGTESDPFLIYNNMIGGGFRSAGYQTSGIYLGEGTAYFDLIYNSINVDKGSGAALYVDAGVTGLRIINNSLAYSGSTNGRAAYYASPASLLDQNYNNFFSGASENFIYYGSEIFSLTPLRNDGHDQNSEIGDPMYVSVTDLHAQGTQLWVRGVPVANIQDDIDGDLRDPLNPCVGADEFEPPTNDLAATSLSGPAAIVMGSENFYVLTVTNYGMVTQPEYTIKLIKDDDTTELASVLITIPIDRGQTVIHTLSWTPDTEGTYNIYGQVILTGDENPANDQTPLFQVNVASPIIEFPFSEDFNTVSVPAMPAGWTVENANDDHQYWVTTTSNPYSAPNAAYCAWNSEIPADDWFFTPPLLLQTGTEYQLSFMYRSHSSSYNENLKVQLGTSANSGAMSGEILFDRQNFNHNAYLEGSAVFSVAVSGIYYLGWHKYSSANQWGVYVDDILITAVTTELGSPEVIASIIDGLIILSWDNIPGANSYLIYSSDDPYNDNWGEPVGIVSEPEYTEEILSEMKFFRVVASTESFPAARSNYQRRDNSRR